MFKPRKQFLMKSFVLAASFIAITPVGKKLHLQQTLPGITQPIFLVGLMTNNKIILFTIGANLIAALAGTYRRLPFACLMFIGAI